MTEETRKRSVNLYEVVYVAVLVILLVFGMFFMGRPKVGVMDITQVAQAVGVEERINQDVGKAEESARAELMQMSTNHDLRVQALQVKVDAAASAADKDKLRQEMNEANQEHVRQWTEVQTRVRDHRQKLYNAFREKLQPFINNVAQKKRLQVVIERSGRVVYAVSSVDITGAVTEEARLGFTPDSSLLEPEGDDVVNE